MNRRSRRKAAQKKRSARVPWWVLVLLGIAALTVGLGRVLRWY